MWASTTIPLILWQASRHSTLSNLPIHNSGARRSTFPTSPSTISELQNPLHYIPELHKIRRSPDLEALKLWKGLSGSFSDLEASVKPSGLEPPSFPLWQASHLLSQSSVDNFPSYISLALFGSFSAARSICKFWISGTEKKVLPRGIFQRLLPSNKNKQTLTSLLKRLHFKELTSRPSAVNVCNRGKGGTNVYNFLSLHFLSAVVPAVLSKDRLSEYMPWKLWPTGLEVSSF